MYTDVVVPECFRNPRKALCSSLVSVTEGGKDIRKRSVQSSPSGCGEVDRIVSLKSQAAPFPFACFGGQELEELLCMNGTGVSTPRVSDHQGQAHLATTSTWKRYAPGCTENRRICAQMSQATPLPCLSNHGASSWFRVLLF